MRQDISFSAKDAAKLVSDFNNLLEVESRQEYIHVIDVITNSAKNGHNKVEIYGALLPIITDKLHQQGFSVKTISNQFVSSHIIISW